VLKSSEYLVHTYTDSVLRASIIRACTRDELEYTDPDLERVRAQQAHALIGSSNVYVNNLRAELELAISPGKFPASATTNVSTTSTGPHIEELASQGRLTMPDRAPEGGIKEY
jgi:hypothetical protein